MCVLIWVVIEHVSSHIIRLWLGRYVFNHAILHVCSFVFFPSFPRRPTKLSANNAFFTRQEAPQTSTQGAERACLKREVVESFHSPSDWAGKKEASFGAPNSLAKCSYHWKEKCSSHIPYCICLLLYYFNLCYATYVYSKSVIFSVLISLKSIKSGSICNWYSRPAIPRVLAIVVSSTFTLNVGTAKEETGNINIQLTYPHDISNNFFISVKYNSQ